MGIYSYNKLGVCLVGFFVVNWLSGHVVFFFSSECVIAGVVVVVALLFLFFCFFYILMKMENNKTDKRIFIIDNI